MKISTIMLNKTWASLLRSPLATPVFIVLTALLEEGPRPPAQPLGAPVKHGSHPWRATATGGTAAFQYTVGEDAFRAATTRVVAFGGTARPEQARPGTEPNAEQGRLTGMWLYSGPAPVDAWFRSAVAANATTLVVRRPEASSPTCTEAAVRRAVVSPAVWTQCLYGAPSGCAGVRGPSSRSGS